jgi:hypothetical protein
VDKNHSTGLSERRPERVRAAEVLFEPPDADHAARPDKDVVDVAVAGVDVVDRTAAARLHHVDDRADVLLAAGRASREPLNHRNGPAR